MIEAIDSYYRNSNANVHRSMHVLAAEAEALYEGGRRKVAELVGARPGEIVFVRNATEAINLVRFTWAREHVGARRRGADHRDGAPLQHRAVAAAVRRSRARGSSTSRSTARGGSTCPTSTSGSPAA